MPVVDPSGIQIAVKVQTTRGAEFALWMGGAQHGEGDAAESIFLDANVEFTDLPIVTAVNIEFTRSYNATCTVELGAPYELGLSLLASDLFIVGNRIVVTVGYPRIGLFLPRISTMAVKPSISINPDDGLTATLNGQGGTFAATRGRNTRQWHAKSIKDVLEDLANYKHNMWRVVFPEQAFSATATKDPEAPIALRDARDPNDPLYGERASITQQNETDWQFARRLIRVAACRMTVRPVPNEGGRTQIIIVRESETAKKPPVYTLIGRGQIDMIAPNGRFPLLTLESEAENVWMEAGTDRAESQDIDPESGEPTEVVTSDVDRVSEDSPPATDGLTGTDSEDGEEVNVAVAADPADGGDLRVMAPAADRSRTPQEAVDQGNRESSERGAGIHVTVSSIGLPMAFPDDRLRLENVGLFDGNYEIDGMSHQVGEGEWTTSYRLIRRGGFGSQYYDEILRRDIDWSAEDDPPEDQPEAGEDAGSGGSILVDAEPANEGLTESELGELTGIDLG